MSIERTEHEDVARRLKMLDAYVIEEIRRRERERTRDDRPAIELPLPKAPARAPERHDDDDDGGRGGGVVIIDYSA